MLQAMKAIPHLICCLFLCPLFLDAQQVDNPTLDGVFIYKRYPFYQDRLAQAVEYRSVSFHRNVTHVFLEDGQRMTLPADTDVIWIPYPGRGGYDRETAFSVIAEAQARYPQYRQLLENVRRAWKRATPVELATQQEKSTNRNLQASGLIASFTRTLSAGLFKLKEIPSLLVSPSLNPTPSATPAKEETSGASTSNDNKSTSQTDLEKNLETIRKYYQMTNDTP